MSALILRGLPAAGGLAIGPALMLHDAESVLEGPGGEAERERALLALERVAEELERAATRLRLAGRVDEADILETSRLIAADPSLVAEVEALAAEKPAAAALVEATERQAATLAELDDPLLASRAADVRRLGRRAARVVAGAPELVRPREPAILLARDLGPADVAELDLGDGRICALALADGAATSHAAIMARALGLPMAVGLGDGLLQAVEGEQVVVDGDAGVAVLSPGMTTANLARAAVRRREVKRSELAAARDLPSTTADGRRVRLLGNASTAAEVAAALGAGAEGVGLVRTELAFLDAAAWPSEAQHAAALAPVLGALAGRTGTVRTLDFGADKTPPFLAGIAERGLELMLAHPEALTAQFRGILRAAAGTRLRLLLPLVQDGTQLADARALLAEALEAVSWADEPPALGAMIETPEAAGRAHEIACEADFLSIGTNDLVQYTLELDRELPLATAWAAADPAVLAGIARVTKAARQAGLTVEVCGEAAGELPLAGLLVGLGVDELSVAPARLDEVRAAIRLLSAEKAAEAARAALEAGSAQRALELAEDAFLRQPRHKRGKARDGLGSILT